jgi:dihydrofolate reductase
MLFFKNTTSNKCVVMGDNTQRSLPKMYLKNRFNIVLCKEPKTNTPSIISDNDKDTTNLCYVQSIGCIPSTINLFNYFQNETKKFMNIGQVTDDGVYIIGGGQVYRQFLNNDLIDTVYLTKVHHSYKGDTFIPNLYELGFTNIEVLRQDMVNENGIKYDILRLTK